ncbi:hypothetical protein EQF93_00015 [Helcococcus ovis]|uniref:hypothetical protein n=1 Tax=Helcococcus ovis TaxID=72026 RepID=UPI00106FA22D|nr:hypothetical protein [Helcococcus ovis]TFF68843.1 hypothetical protein EQF93_00015 [Helcococcus ovis]WNZ00728.1 hypothetical protein EQF90_005555 [Helcococcus ovis]
MKLKKFTFILFAICIILSACGYIHVKSGIINKDAKYITLSPHNSQIDIKAIISLYDEDGKFLESHKFNKVNLDRVTCYNDNIYYHGPRGVIKVDRNKGTIKKILDSSSDIIDEEDGILYYNENGGFVKFPNPEYKVKICKFGEKECMSFNEIVYGFKVLKNKLYVILDSPQLGREIWTLKVYDFKTKKLLDEQNVPKGTDLQKAGNKIYVTELEKLAYEYNNKENILVTKYKNKEDILSKEDYIRNIYLNKNGKLFIEKYNFETGESIYSLYNFTDKKEIAKISDGNQIFYAPYSDIFIEMDTHNNKFIDLNSNKTINAKQFNNYKTFNAIPLR